MEITYTPHTKNTGDKTVDVSTARLWQLHSSLRHTTDENTLTAIAKRAAHLADRPLHGYGMVKLSDLVASRNIKEAWQLYVEDVLLNGGTINGRLLKHMPPELLAEFQVDGEVITFVSHSVDRTDIMTRAGTLVRRNEDVLHVSPAPENNISVGHQYV